MDQFGNFLKNERICSPLEHDLPTTPEPVVCLDSTGKEVKAYPALIHDLYRKKGRILDAGWKFRWFASEGEAAKKDAEARREAKSYIAARRLEAELMANIHELVLPVATPASYVAPSHTPEQILEMAGFSSGQYRILTDVSYWHSERMRGGYFGGSDVWTDGRLPTGSLAKKGEDGIWEIGQTGLSYMVEDTTVGGPRHDAWVKSVLAEMGVGSDKIAAIKSQLKAEREAAESDHRLAVQATAKSLQTRPTSRFLSKESQDRLANMVEIGGHGDFSWLTIEWAKAEVIRSKVESGEILFNFGGHFRQMGMSGNAKHWVVRSNGDERKPEKVIYRKDYFSEGEESWKFVGADELALTWSCETMSDVASSSQFIVSKLPVGGCTKAQLDAVARIENDLGVPNAFGLNAETQKAFEERLAEIIDVCQHSQFFRSVPELDFRKISSGWGQLVEDESCLEVSPNDLLNWAEGFPERCENRDAQIVNSQLVGDGYLEFVVYSKWGRWNLNIRWRKSEECLTSLSQSTATKDENIPESNEVVDLSKVDLSDLFGGNVRVRR